jgi:hypothetical protein
MALNPTLSILTPRLACTALVIALGGATPALAQGSAVPEPSTLVLFGLGVAGVIIGRRGGKSDRK